jgi:hypothetical protein
MTTSDSSTIARITYCTRNARRALTDAIAMSSANVAMSTTSAGCWGKTYCQPPRNPNTYWASASVWDR